jgi:hypothetical protein
MSLGANMSFWRGKCVATREIHTHQAYGSGLPLLVVRNTYKDHNDVIFDSFPQKYEEDLCLHPNFLATEGKKCNTP